MANRYQSELVLDAHAQVAEGPIWEPRDNALIWVDILRNQVHQFDPANGRDRAWDVGQSVGAAASRQGGGLVLAVERGFAFFDPASGTFELVAEVEADNPANRMNDGKCDRAGRFYAGTMAYDYANGAGAGSFYRLDPDRRVTKLFDDLTISNGLDWSNDDRRMYFVDTPTFRIDVFDYDAASGNLANRRPLIEIPREAGMPDGLTVDSQDYIWVSLYGAGAIHRYSPDGTLERVVGVDSKQTTSCSFGGANLDELYITSANNGMSPEALQAEPHAGGLFRYRAGVTGRQPNRYAG